MVAANVEQRWQDWAQICFLGLIWGGGFLLMRIAAPQLGSYPLVGLRLGLGALVTFPLFWQSRRQFTLQRLPMILFIGVINSALPFLLLAWASEHAPAAIGAMTNATTVLFTAIVAVLFFHEKMGIRRIFAVGIGFVGAVVLSMGKADGLSFGPSALAGIGASLCYGIGYNMVKSYMADLPASALSVAAMSCSALIVAPMAWYHWPTQTISFRVWCSVAILGAVCTGFAYCVYYRLIQRIGPSRACVVTYLVPVFGSVMAWLILGEAMTWLMVLAEGLILGSVSVGL